MKNNEKYLLPQCAKNGIEKGLVNRIGITFDEYLNLVIEKLKPKLLNGQNNTISISILINDENLKYYDSYILYYKPEQVNFRRMHKDNIDSIIEMINDSRKKLNKLNFDQAKSKDLTNGLGVKVIAKGVFRDTQYADFLKTKEYKGAKIIYDSFYCDSSEDPVMKAREVLSIVKKEFLKPNLKTIAMAGLHQGYNYYYVICLI